MKRSWAEAKCFVGDRRAVALIEFAFVLPVLLLMFAGVVEITRYVLVNQKLDKAASQVTNFVAQTPNPKKTSAYASQLDTSFKTMLEPYDDKSGGYAVTGFGREVAGGPIKVDFQHRYGSVASKFGGAGSTVSPSALKGLVLNNRDYVIAVEVSYKYSTLLTKAPLISKALDFNGKQLHKTTFHRYRFDAERNELSGNPQTMESLGECCGYYCNPIRVTNPKTSTLINGDTLERGEDDLKCACYPLDTDHFYDPAKDGNTCDRNVAAAFSSCELMKACEACSWSACCGTCGCSASRSCLPENPDCHTCCSSCGCSASEACPASNPNCHDACPPPSSSSSSSSSSGGSTSGSSSTSSSGGSTSSSSGSSSGPHHGRHPGS